MIMLNKAARSGAKPRPSPGPLILCAVVTLVLVLVAAAVAINRPTLVVQDPAGEKVLKIGRISRGDRFELRFTHSVDLLPVHDTFIYRDGTLVLDQTRCLSFGAGLGYMGQGELKGDGKWNVIDNMNRRVGALPLRVGTIADHTIIYKGKEYHLADYFAPRSLVMVEVRGRF